MDSALTLDRIHFAFTVTYHYLFPQLTMGLALLILVLKTIAIRKSDDRYNRAARFWARIFAVNFKVLYDDLIHFDESVADVIKSTGSN